MWKKKHKNISSDLQSVETEVYTEATTKADRGPAEIQGRGTFTEGERQRPERGFSSLREQHEQFQKVSNMDCFEKYKMFSIAGA